MNFAQQFHKARRKNIPLIAIKTVDPQSTITTLAQGANGNPVVVWDIIRGINGFNDAGRKLMEQDEVFRDLAPESMAHPVQALTRAAALPDGVILFLINGHVVLENHAAVQAIWNLRDLFKGNYRTCAILGPSFKLPPTLIHDVLVLDEPMPDQAQLAAIVIESYKAAELPVPKDAAILKSVDAITGLGAFTAEQMCALAMEPNGLDDHELWEYKRKQIEAVGGLEVYRGNEMPSDVKGADNAVEFLCSIMEDVSCVFFLDELDKMFAGMGNSQDSTTKEMVGRFLKWMDTLLPNGKAARYGNLLLGPAGTGKSMIAKAIGNKFKRPTIMADFSGMKDSLVGQSQHNLEHALKITDAVAGDKPILVIATCNSDIMLPPEVQRRFNFGTFFVDLPDEDARLELWHQYASKFDIGSVSDKEIPPDTSWTGAEIRNCCMIAEQRKAKLKDAAQFVVPVARKAAEQVEALRKHAAGRYTSAAKPGLYEIPTTKSTSFPINTVNRRSINTKN